MPPRVYQVFKRELYRRDLGTPIGQQFKDYLKDEIEKMVSFAKPVFMNTDTIRISHIYFAFNNPELIALLRKRGYAIANANHEKEQDMERQIDRLKSLNLDGFVVPVSAFITFENQEGFERAQQFTGRRRCFKVEAERELMDMPLVFKRAPEPTNIIWENRHFTYLQQSWRAAAVALAVLLVLVGVFVLFFVLKTQVANTRGTYANVECENTVAEYGSEENL